MSSPPPPGSSTLRRAGAILIALGLALLIYYAFSLWERRQAQAEALRELDSLALDASPARARRELSPGDLVARILVPAGGVDAVAFEGIDAATLRLGVGHFPGTPLPGEKGNSSFAAHRDSFFRGLRKVSIGDAVRIERGGMTYSYTIRELEIVEPSRVDVVRSRGRSEVTLVTCYPFDHIGPAPRRFVVRASFEDAAPTG